MAGKMAVHGLTSQYARLKGESEKLQAEARKYHALYELHALQAQKHLAAVEKLTPAIAQKEADVQAINAAALLVFGKDLSSTPARKTVPHHTRVHGSLTREIIKALRESSCLLDTREIPLAIAPHPDEQPSNGRDNLAERVRHTLKRLRMRGITEPVNHGAIPGQRTTWILAANAE